MFNSKAGLGDVVEKAEESRAQSTSRNGGKIALLPLLPIQP